MKSSAREKDRQCRRLQEQLDNTSLRLNQVESQLKQGNLENAELRKACKDVEQQQSATAMELRESQQKCEQEIAKNKDLLDKLAVLSQHLADEAVRQSGSSTLSVAFDTPQRQQQYTQAFTSLLQPIVDKYILNVEILQRPKHCNFLVYITFSSTARLVNFDNAAYAAFKQGCSTGENAVSSMQGGKGCTTLAMTFTSLGACIMPEQSSAAAPCLVTPPLKATPVCRECSGTRHSSQPVRPSQWREDSASKLYHRLRAASRHTSRVFVPSTAVSAWQRQSDPRAAVKLRS